MPSNPQGNTFQQCASWLGHLSPSIVKLIKPFLKLIKKTNSFEPEVTATINGFPYLLNINDFIQQQMFYFGCFDFKGVFFITDLCRKINCKTALDIGSNVGNHAVHLSSVCTSLYAFEPNDTVASVFQKALDNKKSNITLVTEGLSNENATVPFFENPQNLGGSSFIKEHASRKVEVTQKELTISHAGEAIQRLGISDIDFIKIDVEGLEYEVIDGLESIIQRDQPLLDLEFNRITAKKFESFEKLKRKLPGYIFYGTKKYGANPLSTKLVLCDFNMTRNYAHIIAVPKRFQDIIST